MKRLFSTSFLTGLLAVVLFFGIQAFLVLRFLQSPGESEPARTAEIPSDEPARFYWDFWTPEIDAFVDDLKAQRLALDERKAELAAIEARVRAESLELEQTRLRLEAFRSRLEESIVEVGLTEEKNLKSLAVTYSNLSPAAALMILQEMEDDVVVKIMMHMKPDVVGAIFEEMTTQTGQADLLVKRAAVLSNRLRLARKENVDTNS
ncbi:MAG: hypothetical protein R3F07_19870 [Opitutaceae bacterium]